MAVSTTSPNFSKTVHHLASVLTRTDAQNSLATRSLKPTSAFSSEIGAVPRRLARKVATVLKLSPNTLPVSVSRASLKAEEATAALGAVGYPGFTYLRNRRPLNPADLLLRTLRAGDVDARVVEALPWVC